MTRSTTTLADAKEAERILLVEDDPGLQSQMKWALAPYDVVAVSTRADALRQFKAENPFQVVILDLGLPPDENGATEGFKTLEEILVMAPKTKIIVASGHTERSSAIKAVGKGAFDFFGKPVDIEVLKLIIERAIRMYALEEENSLLRELPGVNPRLIFSSAKMAQVQRMIERVGPADVSVLIIGETGTGKEVVARALHEFSPRRAARFVAINCASIPENLLESELFGHEKGAFTGAIKQTPGKFELANNGTLFLDEIGDMPTALQAKLLRFLQERQFERVGGRTSINVNVRLVCATNRPLDKLVAISSFREDLYYRINEVRMDLPPLRERENDAIILAQHFFNVLKRATYRDIRGISENALAVIARYEWPGNVRELENRMKRAVVMAEGRLITAEDLDLANSLDKVESLDLPGEVGKLERALAQKALAISEGNISKAARLLSVSRPHLYNLIKSGGLDLSDGKMGECDG
jgi:two-component system NtrC family response regulator